MQGKARLGASAVAAVLVFASVADAKILAPWGSSLTATPTLNTANGASRASGERSTKHAVNPDPHDGADFTLWNTRLPGLDASAPRGGQVRTIRVKGCAIEDHSAPSQLSDGTPVNLINFQSLAPQAGGSYTSIATAPDFRLPFCSNSAHPAGGRVSTGTITSFHPIHMCIGKGDTVGFYDIGGFVPNPNGQGWYPEGVPFEVIAPARGSSMDSFADADAAHGTYARGARPRGPNSGWGTEPGEELMLQVTEGVGGDAYGLCPGGTADESSSSNKVICDYHAPYDGHRRCGAAGHRARKP